MPKLLIATTNPAKAREYREFLSDLGVEVLSLNEFIPRELAPRFPFGNIIKISFGYPVSLLRGS